MAISSMTMAFAAGSHTAVHTGANVSFSLDAFTISFYGGTHSVPSTGYTPTHYVSVTGAGSHNGSLGNEWTLDEAVANAVAGNIIEVAAGTYVGTNTANRFTPAFNPTNSGTLGNEIIFYAPVAANLNTVGLSIIENDAAVAETGCPSFGASVQDYIIWDGFYINEANAITRSDTGPVILSDTTGSKILNCHVVGATITRPGDNHSGIRLDGAVNSEVKFNKIQDVLDDTANHENNCGVQTYGIDSCTIANNEIFNCGSGIFLKGDLSTAPYQPSNTVELNYIHDVARIGLSTARATDTLMRHNLVENTVIGYLVRGLTGEEDCVRPLFHHNTIYNVTYGIQFAGYSPLWVDPTHRDNLIQANSLAIYFDGGDAATPEEIVCNNNYYFGHTNFMELGYANYNFAYWTGTQLKDTTGSSDTTTPTFDNVASGPTGFKLTENGQPALTASSTGGRLGCYETGTEVIGIAA